MANPLSPSLGVGNLTRFMGRASLRTDLQAAGILLFVMAGGGCRHEVREGEREESFSPFVADRVSGVPLSDFLAERTVLLVAGSVPAKIEKKPNGWDIQLALEAGGKPDVGLGSAIPVSLNGYFLTAAHNLAHPPYWVAMQRGQVVEFSEAKAIWSGNPDVPEEDFAILRASLRPSGILAWDDSSSPKPGQEIASMSGPHGRCGGRVLESSRFSSPKIPCSVLSVEHDLPLLTGDSGGPVVGRDGHLIGMNVLLEGNLTASRQGRAIRPDWRWMASIISNGK